MDQVTVHEGVTYTERGGRKMKLDLYLPKRERPPLVVYITVADGSKRRAPTSRTEAVGIPRPVGAAPFRRQSQVVEGD